MAATVTRVSFTPSFFGDGSEDRSLVVTHPLQENMLGEGGSNDMLVPQRKESSAYRGALGTCAAIHTIKGLKCSFSSGHVESCRSADHTVTLAGRHLTAVSGHDLPDPSFSALVNNLCCEYS